MLALCAIHHEAGGGVLKETLRSARAVLRGEERWGHPCSCDCKGVSEVEGLSEPSGGREPSPLDL
eukprot:1183747-Prorocentrum_minimum.AAC.3